ncbi:histone deacetylase 2 isoform X2 [Musa acuminata AAA Group]|uniref:histone deacetylase 2 isoform X2 n=1 Tax=Musa acuminata AAA Group TaxID=214697 RepID=UPI0031D9D52C
MWSELRQVNAASAERSLCLYPLKHAYDGSERRACIGTGHVSSLSRLRVTSRHCYFQPSYTNILRHGSLLLLPRSRPDGTRGCHPQGSDPLQQSLLRRSALQGACDLLVILRHRVFWNRETVHSESYLSSLKSSLNVATIIEVPPVSLLPNCLVQNKVLYPFRKQVGGSILAAKLAKERGWAINIGGGFHHCSAENGGGFCAYADISLCIQFAFVLLNISRVMIIDLDAHQGNGHEIDFSNDRRVYILDMYNAGIYPFDFEAKRYIDQKVELASGTKTKEYLDKLDEALEVARNNFNPELVVYNAGTDILDGDPLGRLKISPDGVMTRDEKVFRFARERNIPLLMLTSGGYMKSSARVIADSIINLSKKNLIALDSPLGRK